MKSISEILLDKNYFKDIQKRTNKHDREQYEKNKENNYNYKQPRIFYLNP